MVDIMDYLDLKILNEITDDAKRAYADIGRRLKIHPNVISYRLNRLKKTGIIKNFTVNLDLEKMGLAEQVILGVNFPPGYSREKALKEIISLPQTLYAISSLGSPEGLIFIASKNKSDLDATISKLKRLNIIIEYTSPVIKIHQKNQMGRLLEYLITDKPKEKDKIVKELEEVIPNIETSSW